MAWAGALSGPRGVRAKWLFFHKDRGKRRVSCCVFINIVATRKVDIFSRFVFTNIARLSCIFDSPCIPHPYRAVRTNLFRFSSLRFRQNPAVSV